MTWLLLSDSPARGPWNMALDDALLETADADGLCVLRLYAWDPPTLSFGRNEPALRRYDRDAIAQRGLATVRRPTGGRAVWHHREVTYAVTAPVATFGSLRDTYLEDLLVNPEMKMAVGIMPGSDLGSFTDDMLKRASVVRAGPIKVLSALEAKRQYYANVRNVDLMDTARRPCP